MPSQPPHGPWPFLRRSCGRGTFISLLFYANLMVPVAALEWWCWIPILCKEGLTFIADPTAREIVRLIFITVLLLINGGALIRFAAMVLEFCRKPLPITARASCLSVLMISVSGQAYLIIVCFATHA